MTNKTTMPDPMVEVDNHVVSSELQYTYLAPSGGLEHGTELITTEQAEAYADARVREALEEAAAVVEQHDKEGREWVRGSLWDAVTREAASRIRALIPKERK